MIDLNKLMADFGEISKEAIFSDIDREFSLFISEIDSSPETVLAALLVSYATMAGNVCLFLPAIAGKPLKDVMADAQSRLCMPRIDKWTSILRKSPAIGEPREFTPMILDKSGRLYLQRYWYYEDMLARNIKDRAEKKDEPHLEANVLLNTLFPFYQPLPEGEKFINKDINKDINNGINNSCKNSEPDWQKVAAAVSLMNNFTVITGGPGTGKTTTIAKILIALCIIESKKGKKLSSAVTAPTGKAAARLMESINSALEKVAPLVEMIKDAIPTEPHTIHRLLGFKRGSTFFRHNKENPLPYDLVIVDESSMADLPLMAKLFDAVHLKSKIILLGDNNQLSSVESGAVLGDICSGPDCFSKEFADKIRKLDSGFEFITSNDIPSVADSIVMLKKSYRFGEKSGIGALSTFVNNGEPDKAVELLMSGRYEDVSFIEIDESTTQSKGVNNLDSLIKCIAIEEYKKSSTIINPVEAFELLTKFRILTPVRKGNGGVENINRYINDSLSNRQSRIYNGLPVIIKRNDYGMGLYNGDIGIFLNDNDGLRVFFQGQKGFRRFMPGRLPEHEIAYTLTVHKSQGSEFDRILLIIPASRNPVLTREMLYTAITRAKQEVIIVSSIKSIVRMIENPIKRYSGLTEALWGNLRV